MIVGTEILAVAKITTVPAVLGQFWPVAAVAFLVSVVATPICQRVALKYRIVDRPDDFLKPHQKPIPYLGGVAIFLGWLAGVVYMMATSRPDPGASVRIGLMAGIAVAGTTTMLVGLFDDLRVMSAKVKLACNLAVALFLLWLGLGDKLVHVMTSFTGLQFSEHERWLELAYSLPMMLLIVVGASNATNLIDGLDGLCTGVLGIISIGFVVLATYMRLYGDAPVTNERIVLALAMLGAAAGFLPYNLNPAKIFMGDAGSMLLGLNAAIILLLFADEPRPLVKFMSGALMVFGLPVADMLLTLARRWRNGRPLMEGDRSHFYDQLVDRGLTVKQVVGISYLLTSVFVLAGVSVIFLRTRYVVLAYILMVCMVIGLIWKFNMASIEPDRRRPQAAGQGSGEPASESGGK